MNYTQSMEIQLLLDTLAANIRASLEEFQSINVAPDLTTGVARNSKPLDVAINHESRVRGEKDTETRTAEVASVPRHATLRAEKVTVYVYCKIQKIGEVDTVGEKFYAELQVNSRWREPALDGTRKNAVEVFDRWNDHWNPDLQVTNAFAGVREVILYNLLYDAEGRATVQEQRMLYGNFSESLELGDYPFDVQELTVRLSSTRDEAEVRLERDPDTDSTLNTESFANRQQWTLSKTVRVWTTTVCDAFSSNSTKKQPLLCMCCVVKRKAAFFVWNIILVMICICSMIFTTFTIEVDVQLVSGRLALSFFILLSNVTFKFSVSSTIPKVPYLTYLDRYIIISMVLLCAVCVWNAVVTLFEENARYADHVALCVLLSCYVVFNIIFVIKSKYKSRKRREL